MCYCCSHWPHFTDKDVEALVTERRAEAKMPCPAGDTYSGLPLLLCHLGKCSPPLQAVFTPPGDSHPRKRQLVAEHPGEACSPCLSEGREPGGLSRGRQGTTLIPRLFWAPPLLHPHPVLAGITHGQVPAVSLLGATPKPRQSLQGLLEGPLARERMGGGATVTVGFSGWTPGKPAD